MIEYTESCFLAALPHYFDDNYVYMFEFVAV